MKPIMETHPSERALIDACLRHEMRAFHELFVRFHRAVHAGAAKAIARRLAVCGTADDLSSQFFLQVVECPEKMLHGLAGRADLASWITAVAYRQCSKMLRSQEWSWPGTRPVARSRNLDTLAAPVHPMLHAADVARIALERLDHQSRAIIQLRFGLASSMQPLSFEKMADCVGCSRRTICRRLHEALRRLRTVAHGTLDALDE